MSNASYPNPGIKWGLIAGVAGIIAGLAVFYTDRSQLFSLTYGIVLLVIYSICAVMAGVQKRKQLGGVIAFKQALQPIFATFVIATLIGTIYIYVTYNYLDPTLPAQMKQSNIDSFKGMEKVLRVLGTPQEDIDQQLEDIKKNDYSITIAGSLLSYTSSLIKYFILSAVLSLIVRKKQRA